MLAAIELGGTKVICQLADTSGDQIAEFRFPTETPERTLTTLGQRIVDALPPGKTITGIGVASFGPIDVAPASESFGVFLQTPKPGWSDFDLAGALNKEFGAPIAMDTDVNAAALAEHACGAGRGLHSVAYVTVGTGIGAGLIANGAPLRGLLHPEAGHLPILRAPGDAFESRCRFHENCVEGLTAGPALQARLGGRALDTAPETQALAADYLGQLCASLVLAWAPQAIILGGGVIAGNDLIPAIQTQMTAHLGGYGPAARVAQPGYLRRAELTDAGLIGALLMARAQAGT
ncbi:ROK family protein [Hyphomonas sp. WL0036]|uniref:ROK family protein n=1 Tax=Hyphomonas sediminis TaxID=2866160 RepID=UPI001C802551|nr:ROK family protein [Hyphomonas sediminis]MBY9068114.1 ROK family protein [Hyphomonas sediminis]